jgi:hypothetical protein
MIEIGHCGVCYVSLKFRKKDGSKRILKLIGFPHLAHRCTLGKPITALFVPSCLLARDARGLFGQATM